MEKTKNLSLPLIDTSNTEDLKKTFIQFVALICGTDSNSAMNIIDLKINDIDTKIGNISLVLDQINGEVI